jgi:hypothetical protein
MSIVRLCLGKEREKTSFSNFYTNKLKAVTIRTGNSLIAAMCALPQVRPTQLALRVNRTGSITQPATGAHCHMVTHIYTHAHRRFRGQ